MTDLLRASAAAFAVAFTACAFIWLLTGGRAHRSDRIGSAALAIGFVAGFVVITGGGWHPAEGPNYLPLVAVVFAQLAPRLFATRFPELDIALAPRIGLLAAALGGGGLFVSLGDTTTAGLLLSLGGAALGIVASAGLKSSPSAGLALTRGLEQRDAAPGRDPRPATWLVLGVLVVAVIALR